jgi:hypothetical protein
MLYRKDDLTGSLPLGTVEPLARPGVKYELTFSPGLLTKIFQRKASDGSLENLIPNPRDVLGGTGECNAGYVGVDNNGYWWKTTGRISYAANPAASAAQELVEARNSFFLPKCFL